MRHFSLAVVASLACAIGCGGGTSAVVKVQDAEHARSALLGRDAQTLAPQAFAEADQALQSAREAERAGDTLGADLHAEHALAAYEHALAIARLTRATEQEVRANEALARAVEQSDRFVAARKAAERDVDDLEKQLRVAREAERPTSSGPTDPERERARLVAAQSLAVQARLLCSAARLVSPQAPGLAEAETQAGDLEKKLDTSPRPAPIDQAGRVRAACLGALTKARRSTANEKDPADALLGELSRARLVEGGDPAKGKSGTLLAPARDERGVVVTLHSVFKADALSPEGEAILKELARVAVAHPDFAVQVVIHDAAAPSAEGAAQNKKRADAIKKALTDSGVNPSKTTVEQAGAKAPVFDPTDARRKANNARVEVVFVGGS
jgi:outer membrane protein OmpA-like peptidoglycan-associated protein